MSLSKYNYLSGIDTSVNTDQLKSQVKSAVLYNDILENQIQAAALGDPSSFIQNYEAFMSNAVDAITDTTFQDALNNYADHVGYPGSLNELLAEVVVLVTKEVSDAIVGAGKLDEAISKLRHKSNSV